MRLYWTDEILSPKELQYFDLYFFEYGISPTQNEHNKAPETKNSLC